MASFGTRGKFEYCAVSGPLNLASLRSGARIAQDQVTVAATFPDNSQERTV